MIPEVWLQGEQLTGYASDQAPVLAGLSLEWGADNDIEHQSPAELTFTVRFLDGIMNNVNFVRGAQIEITWGDATVFAGTLRSAQAVPVGSALELTAKCIEHIADLDGVFVQTQIIAETSTVRWQTLRNLFALQQWELEPRARNHSFAEANTFYNSIKLLTLIERYLAANGQLTRWDNSARVAGQLVRRVGTGLRGASTAASRLTTNGTLWAVSYSSQVNTGVITWLDARNVLDGPWSIEAGTAINSAKISTQRTRIDSESGQRVTDTEESVRNDTASIEAYGVNTVEVATSSYSEDPNWLSQIASTWFKSDTDWILETATIRDSTELTDVRLRRLLDSSLRSQNLIIIRGIFSRRPMTSASNLRASLIGGSYTWNGERWELDLKLGRNQRFTAPNQYTFADIAAHSNTAISNGTAASIGRGITFADFQQISKG